jgi:GTP-binding protein HflX
VEKILGSLGLDGKKRLLVFNKMDRLPPGEGPAIAHARDGVAISASTRDGLEALLHRCDRLLWADGRVSFGDVAASAPPPAATPAEDPHRDDRIPEGARAAPSASAPARDGEEGPPRLLPARLLRVS